MVEADARLFPDDPQSRDLAQQVFERRGLWDPALVLSAPEVELDLQGWDELGAGARAALVARYAAELRIPAGPGIRLLTPRLTTAVRDADAAKTGVDTAAVTERYLHYAYELVVQQEVWGENGPELVGISLFNGGTLVLDAQWKAVLLVTDPPLVTEDVGDEDPAESAFRRAVDRFQQMHLSGLRSLESPGPGSATGDRVLVDRPGCPFTVKAVGNGALRFVRRRCEIAEHLRAIGSSSAVLRLPGSGRVLHR
jgi:hypothetical protein